MAARHDARPPDAVTIAAAVGASEADVRGAMNELARQHLIALTPRTHEIWMAHPFSAIPTAFAIAANGRTYYANCAWDAAGVLSIVGDGSCRAQCGDCESDLSFSVTAGQLRGHGVVHFTVPARHFWDDIGFT